MRSGRTLARLSLVFSALLTSGTIFAQQRPRSPTVLFAPTGNFQNPGARSFALGGAFVGLADDASAAELNPAGLTQLRRPEISVEYRSLESVIPVRYTGAVAFGAFECVGGFEFRESFCDNSGTSEEDSLSFVSLIVPGAGRLTYALYRHELDRERFTVVRPMLLLPDRLATGSIQRLERRLVRTGVALAADLGSGLSLGLTANLNSMTQDFRILEYLTPSAGGEDLGGPPRYLTLVQESRIDAEKVGGTAGVLWRPIRALSLGASYSTRVRFDEEGVRNFCVGRISGLPDCGFLEDGTLDPENLYLRFGFSPTFTLPARAGASVAVRPTGWLVLVAEGDLVTYSENDIEIDRPDPETGEIVATDRLTADDVWELHAGAEVVLPFARSGVLAFRAGYWRDPDHSFRYDRCRAVGVATCQPDLLFTLTNPPRGDLDHYTGGLGVAWAWGQIDVGYDWIEQHRIGTVSASLVIRAR